MWDMLHYMCRDRGLVFSPETVHIDFEKAMHNSVRRNFRQANISCCCFHLGQSIWRKIQTIGFSAQYRDKDSEIGKWLTLFYGLPYLDTEEIEDCFVMDIMSSEPDDAKCHQFADYMLENYVSSDARYPPQLWADIPRERSKRTTNVPEAFHSHFNGQFYSTHPSIFTFIDVITKIQTTTYVKMRCLNIDTALQKPEKERISFLLRQFEMYSVGELNRYQYIKSIGFKFAARTNLSILLTFLVILPF